MAKKDDEKKKADAKAAPEPKAEPKPEPEPKAEAKPEPEPEPEPEGPQVPPVDQIMKQEDCSNATAVKLHDALLSLERERAFREFARKRKGQAHYVCKAMRPQGYWRIGRKFDMSETIVFLDELTPEQRKELETTDPVHMKVQKVSDHQVKDSWKPTGG